MDIHVTQVCGEDVISRDAGKKIRELILHHWQEPKIRILLDGRTVASASFFDEAIGLLLKKANKTLAEIKDKLVFPDLQPEDRQLLNDIIAKRVEELY